MDRPFGSFESELDRSIGDNFVDLKLGVLRLKSHIAAKRWDKYMSAFDPDARYTPAQNPGIAAFNGQLVDGNEIPIVIAVMEFDALEDAARDRKIGAMRAFEW